MAESPRLEEASARRSPAAPDRWRHARTGGQPESGAVIVEPEPDAQLFDLPPATCVPRARRVVPRFAGASFEETTTQPAPPADPTPPGAARRPRARTDALAGWCLAAVGVALTFTFIRFTDDGAFLDWRYGRMLVDSHVWSWNPTGQPVEAGTGPVYALLSAIPAQLGMPVELFFKLVALLTLAAFLAWTRRRALPRPQQWVLLGTVMLSPVFFVSLFSGAPTVPFALSIVVAFARLYRDGRLGTVGYVATVAMTLLRPEGLWYAVVALGWALTLDCGRRNLVGTTVFLAGFGGYWGWRTEYFGHLWPNSFHAVSHDGSVGDQLVRTLQSALPVLVTSALGLWIGLQIVRRSVDRAFTRKLIERAAWRDATPVVLAVTSATVVLGLYQPLGLTGSYGNRFCWQALFPVVVVALSRPLLGLRAGRRYPFDGWALVAVVLSALVAADGVGSGRTGQGVVLVVLVALGVGVLGRILLGDRAATVLAAAGLAVLISRLPITEATGLAAYRYRLAAADQALGTVLAGARIDGAIAVADAGALAFAVPNPVLDLTGRANDDLARRTFTAADLTRAHVRVVVGVSTTPGTPTTATTAGQRIAYAWATAAGFRYVPGPEFSPGRRLNLWIDPDVADDSLLRAIDAVRAASERQTATGNLHLLSQHLLDLPFLRG